MIYKQYGITGARVSAVGMGGMRFDEQKLSRGDVHGCAALVSYAHEKGINYFDTAPTYSDDKSEEIFGLGLKGLKRDSFYITSKSNFSQLDRPPTEKGFFSRLEKSLRRLQVDYIDFYHLWCMLSIAKYHKQRDALYGWFLKAKEQGLIRHIVVSSHMDGEDMREMLEEGLFEGLLLGYNALNYRYRIDGIKTASARNMGVAVMNPLGGGIIPENPALFSHLNEGTPYTVAQAALRFVAAHEEVSVVLNGFSNEKQVDEAVAAMENLEIRKADDVIAAMPFGGQSLNDLCTGCRYCEYCPEEIPVSKFMDAYNQEMLGHNALYRLKGHWSVQASLADRCTGCGKCERLCTQHLPIRERLKYINEKQKGEA
ncbi:aldo/keto reductase [Christensenellaceae bacterium OttesenSCG-928-M15]|nr:aldo/keto reductase [Christensenellaceae bacterium OttesenSCG-928-M15]